MASTRHAGDFFNILDLCTLICEERRKTLGVLSPALSPKSVRSKDRKSSVFLWPENSCPGILCGYGEIHVWEFMPEFFYGNSCLGMHV